MLAASLGEYVAFIPCVLFASVLLAARWVR